MPWNPDQGGSSRGNEAGFRRASHPERGSLLLLVLCLLAVLGVGLAGFLSVSNQAMKLSNRSFRTGASAQLAEMGLSEAMRAFNNNSWSTWSAGGTTATWSTSGTTANCTITFPASKFGQGVTGTVKIRVDNYNAAQLNSTWVNGTNYRPSDTVNYGGTWYRCVQATSSQVPNGISNMGYWVPTPVASFWDSTISYKDQDVVFYSSDNKWYRCILAHTNQVPTNATYWTFIPRITENTGYTNTNIEILMFFGTWYYWNSAWYPMPASAPIVNWVWRPGYDYSFNDRVYYGGTPVWYRCIVPHKSSGSILPTSTSYWENALASASNAGSWAWNAATSYNLNDVVYRSGSFYRCILAHTNQGPPNSTYWSTAPLKSNAWTAGRYYSLHDPAYYNGTWYRCTAAHIAPSAWTGANFSSTANSPWNSATAYTTSSYVSYGGVWYKCAVAHTNKTPNDATFWTALGAPVVYAEGGVTMPDSTAPIKTQLRATLTPAPLFPNAIAATSTLIISGGGTVDSYDSGVGAYGGANVGYSAVLASTGTTSPAVTVTSTTVKGFVAAPSASSSPYAPMWSYGGSAVLTGSGAGGVDLTRVSRSPSIPQFDIQAVAGNTLLSLGSGTTTIGTPGGTTPSRYITSGNLRVDSGKTLNIIGPVILDVSGEFRVDGGGTVVIAATGSAEIHFSGRLRIDNGAGGIQNQTLDPKKLVLLGTASGGTGHDLSTQTYPFYGAIYMPNSSTALTIGPGVAIYGALSAKNITFSSEATVHYDTSLRFAVIPGVDQPYAVTEWRELTDLAERATLP